MRPSSSFHSLGSLKSFPQGSGDRLFNQEFNLQTYSSLWIDNVRTRSLSVKHTITKSDIRASEEKILHTFLLKGAEREIDLPLNIKTNVTKSIEENRHNPEIFEAIERNKFPNFLDYKDMRNFV